MNSRHDIIYRLLYMYGDVGRPIDRRAVEMALSELKQCDHDHLEILEAQLKNDIVAPMEALLNPYIDDAIKELDPADNQEWTDDELPF